MRVLVSTFPFGLLSNKPRRVLEDAGFELIWNPYGRRMKSGEVGDLLKGVDAVIAGTEPLDKSELSKADRLKVVSRVGVGLDSVDLQYCRDNGIVVTYTPEAPADAVAELAVGQILNLARHIVSSDHSVRERTWNRMMGVLLREIKIGVLGAGRIGSRVIRLLQPFQPQLLVCDQDESVRNRVDADVQWCSWERLFKDSDILTVHIPLNAANFRYVNRERMACMKTGSMLINTSRGNVIDQAALEDALRQHHLGGAALDVFEKEPYEGPLLQLDSTVLTAHIGASASESRKRMELEAAEDCVRVLRGEAPMFDAFKDSSISFRS